MQFLEAPDQINMPNKATYDSQCSAWKNYAKTMYYIKDDSGL